MASTCSVMSRVSTCRRASFSSFSSSLLTRSSRGLPLTSASTTASASTSTSSSSSSSSSSASSAAATSGTNVVDVLRSRGLVEAMTDEDAMRAAASAASTKPLTVYCGFDPTAPSLHLGNLLGIVVLAWFQKCGHNVVALCGGATARVGDPSGKSAERPVLSEEALATNVDGITDTLGSLLRRAGGEENVKVLDNMSWYGSMSLLEFLREVGKNARVGVMMAKDSVKTRLEGEGMSYTEFTYQLLQGYDFYMLRREHGVTVQIGGSDQWGNITAGTDLIRRLEVGDAETDDDADGELSARLAHGLTFPLLLKSDGTKFGKSEGGAVWLRKDALSPYDFYQYLYRTADADVVRLLKSLTFVDLDEIDRLAQTLGDNEAQRVLASEVTRFVHGDEGLAEALKVTQAMAPGKKVAGESGVDGDTLRAIVSAGGAPVVDIARSNVVGQPYINVLVEAGLAKSKGEARRLVKGGGARLNEEVVKEEMYMLKDDDIIDDELLMVGSGKKKKVVVNLT
ncbi:hypothetical protein PPROV_001035000 [Pycnococcus provasolii]|uniref:Tyrosine--tRNA ligase n=1 Tax=Pycnococcus provasolii TaxID=41880 RepID=A0A830HWR4_9CHLO|nr:hypothetical protein PPROV_001035000 [Pycnococcus provasolii]